MTSADDPRLLAAIREFDAANAQDPVRVRVDGDEQPRELVRARRLTDWIFRLEPEASIPLQLAARCQHLRRWEIPRASYPSGRTGYLKWRKDLSHFHADCASDILKAVGYDDEIIERVRQINLKRGLKVSADVQTMEDALCLVFLEHDLTDFARSHADDKVVEILKKSWGKMSSRGREAALALPFPNSIAALVTRATGA